jgi:hypothetical protein
MPPGREVPSHSTRQEMRRHPGLARQTNRDPLVFAISIAEVQSTRMGPGARVLAIRTPEKDRTRHLDDGHTAYYRKADRPALVA